MQARAYILLFICCATLLTGPAYAQEQNKPDSAKLKKLHFTHNTFINNIFQQAVSSVKRNPDSDNDDNYLIGKSEDPYLPYQGKIIRHIYVEPFGMNRSFKDTAYRDKSWAARTGGNLHRTTRKFVIRDNLFIEENTPLNAFKLADNERFIRSLEYIHDARIVIDTLINSPDSVDITVYSKDLFSIAGGASSDGLNHVHADLYDANVAGMGQKLQISGLYDYNRSPNFGYGFYYRKSNLKHTFIDASLGYSVINVSPYTHEEESNQYFSLTRQLVSPYSRFAGGLTISHTENYNLYHLNDTAVYRYRYNLYDVWAGYNIGIKILTATNNTIRDRRFFAIRYYKRDFTEVPFQVGQTFNPVYNSSQAVLGQFTFFRQDYYKTQYIYGFGTTEDLPYGYNISATVGWHKQLNLERPYAGVNVSQYIASHKGDFIQLYFRAGGFLNKKTIEDGSFLIGATAFSRIFFINSTKIRQYINTNYTQQFNRVTYAPLRIDNYYGVRGFLSDSAYGTRRFSIQLETAFYLRFRFLGFMFAPFPYCDFSLITPENAGYSKSLLYTSLGGGIRARNENLIFETIEARAYYFPIAPDNMRGFKIIVDANIRYRYSSNLITAPDLVQLNSQ